MSKPKTNKGGFALVLEAAKTKSALAKLLGVSKQLVSRWEEIPPKYAENAAKIAGMEIGDVVPELLEDLGDILIDDYDRRESLLADLILLFDADHKPKRKHR